MPKYTVHTQNYVEVQDGDITVECYGIQHTAIIEASSREQAKLQAISLFTMRFDMKPDLERITVKEDKNG